MAKASVGSLDSTTSDVLSSSQHVIDICNLESERRKSRLRRLRSGNSTELSGCRTIYVDKNVKPENSIMMIRTLEDSLRSIDEDMKKVIRAQRKRRLLKRRLDGFMKEIDSGGGGGNLRPGSSSSEFGCSISSSSSSISVSKFEVTFRNVSIRKYPIIPGDNPR